MDLRKKYAFVIAVRKTDRSAYNPDRPISSLIEHQIQHLHRVEKALPPRRQTGIDVASIRTERQASNYIQKVTALLHPQGARKVKRVKPQRTPARRKGPRVRVKSAKRTKR
jgi:hypothetical protein